MKITFWGHAAFLVENGSHRVVIDPFLTGNPLATVKPDEVKCDFIIVTHGHGDHLGDTVTIAKNNDAVVIANYEVATYCSNKGCKAHPLHIGGGHDFPFGRVKLTIAHHGSSFIEGDQIIYLGNPAGVLLTMDGKTLYHAGDTALFYDMKLIGEMNQIDVALLPIGDNFTMGVEDAVKAVEFLNPKLTVPMHYKTFDLIDVDPDDFAHRVESLGKQVRVLGVGETLEI